MPQVQKYGVKWPEDMDELQIEMQCIRYGGRWKTKTGAQCGEGLSFHYKQMRKLLWPELDDEDNGQRWHKLCRDAQCENSLVVLAGCASSGKTNEASWFYLCDWWCDPENTLTLVSSTDMRGLRNRVWGEICSLWERGKNKYPYLAGHLIDSRVAITFRDVEGEDDEIAMRDMRQAIQGIPTMQGGKFVGISKFMGLKQKRVRLVADEAQCMGASFLSAFSNLQKNGEFKATILGNPTDMFDPLGKAAEPIDGWDDHLEPEKTTTWRTKFMNGLCVNLIGTDSPNFDFPTDKQPFKYLIDAKKIAATLTMFTKDSWEYFSQCVGVFKIGTMARRVLTRRVCEENGALRSDVVWEGERTRVHAVDAAYGGDRCVGGWAEFGKTIDGKMVLHIHPQVIIPISLKSPKEPEEQIAEHVRRECDANRIPPENMGHDSTGRGTLGTYLARVWSPMTNPIEFGGQPTDRPVTSDMFIRDPKTGVRRLKLCKEHYVKFVTELWFTVRYAVEAGQIRGLSEEAMEEFCQREWDRVSGDRIEIETKGDMKERIGRSPDLADHVAILVEMARRKGFTISKVINEKAQEASSTFMEELARNHRKMLEAKELQFTQ